jgi:hypothetical protein
LISNNDKGGAQINEGVDDRAIHGCYSIDCPKIAPPDLKSGGATKQHKALGVWRGSAFLQKKSVLKQITLIFKRVDVDQQRPWHTSYFGFFVNQQPHDRASTIWMVVVSADVPPPKFR